jgi:hypothetical protein
MAVVAFALPVLPGQEDLVRSIAEMVSGSGELREGYEASRKTLGISEEKVWLQRTPIGHSILFAQWGFSDQVCHNHRF